MTSRERWTVYPLLFLSLGMSWRGRMAEVENQHQVLSAVNCHELTIVNRDNKPVARFGTTKDHTGVLEFYTAGGKPALLQGVDKNGAAHQTLSSLSCRELTVINGDGKLVARFHTTKDQNGFLEFYTTDGKLALLEGVDKSGVGLFGISLQPGHPGLLLPFNQIAPQPPKPEVQAPEEKQSDPQPEENEPTKPDAEPS